jgi:hypothetical protein
MKIGYKTLSCFTKKDLPGKVDNTASTLTRASQFAYRENLKLDSESVQSQNSKIPNALSINSLQ